MLATDESIDIDEKFFEEFTSDLSNEDFLDIDVHADSSNQGKKRDFSSFLTPYEPSNGQLLYGCGSGSPHTTESVSDCSSDDRSKMDPSQKRACRLEKNRASATKCRLKKKNELNSLTEKIGQLMKTISQLTQENAALRADNASLTDHNRFLRNLISSKPELPHYIDTKTESQQAAGAASGIAILGIVGGFTMFSSGGYWGSKASEGVGRVLENPLQDLIQEQASSQLHIFIVGVFLCLVLYATASYGAQLPSVEKMGLLPCHENCSKEKSDSRTKSCGY